MMMIMIMMMMIIIIIIIIMYLHMSFKQPHKTNYNQVLKQEQRIKIIKSTNDIRNQEITVRNERHTVQMYKMKPGEHGQRTDKNV
jgi:predicted membrane protein